MIAIRIARMVRSFLVEAGMGPWFMASKLLPVFGVNLRRFVQVLKDALLGSGVVVFSLPLLAKHIGNRIKCLGNVFSRKQGIPDGFANHVVIADSSESAYAGECHVSEVLGASVSVINEHAEKPRESFIPRQFISRAGDFDFAVAVIGSKGPTSKAQATSGANRLEAIQHFFATIRRINALPLPIQNGFLGVLVQFREGKEFCFNCFHGVLVFG